MPWKPSGYNSASPYLVTADAEGTLDFLEAVFDGRRLRRHDHPDGKVMHAEIQIDDTVIMIGGAQAGWPAVPMHVHVYVPNVDETYRRALAHGGTPVQEPVRKGDEDKRGGVKDPGGTTWWIATSQA
jgi:uncharacterized glyoxalase superfamily protein PhnB